VEFNRWKLWIYYDIKCVSVDPVIYMKLYCKMDILCISSIVGPYVSKLYCNGYVHI